MRKLTIVTLNIGLSLLSYKSALAQVFNPVPDPPPGDLVENPGEAFGYYLAFYWGVFVTVGMIAVLLFFLWGSFDWITSGGDKNKVETARNKMMNAVVGAILLGSAYVIIGFIGYLIGIDLLKPTFFAPGY